MGLVISDAALWSTNCPTSQTGSQAALLSDQESDYQSDQVMRLLRAIRKSQRSTSDLMLELGLAHRPTFRKNYLHPALAGGLIEMTQPDTPRARNQKYRLTTRGRELITIKES